MRGAGRLIAWSLVPLALAACGTSSTAPGLDVSYPVAAAHRAMLASIAPQRVRIAGVSDRRVGAAGARIGFHGENGNCGHGSGDHDYCDADPASQRG